MMPKPTSPYELFLRLPFPSRFATRLGTGGTVSGGATQRGHEKQWRCSKIIPKSMVILFKILNNTLKSRHCHGMRTPNVSKGERRNLLHIEIATHFDDKRFHQPLTQRYFQLYFFLPLLLLFLIPKKKNAVPVYFPLGDETSGCWLAVRLKCITMISTRSEAFLELLKQHCRGDKVNGWAIGSFCFKCVVWGISVEFWSVAFFFINSHSPLGWAVCVRVFFVRWKREKKRKRRWNNLQIYLVYVAITNRSV